MIPDQVLIPRNAKLISIKESYGPLPEEICCGLEGCRALHRKGFVVYFQVPASMEPPQSGVVGHICGKNAFGADWKQAERLYAVQIKAEQISAAKDRFQDRAGRILPVLKAVLPRLEWQNKVRSILLRNAGRVIGLCVEATKSQNGYLKLRSSRGDLNLHCLKGAAFWSESYALALPRARQLEADASRFLDYLASAEPDMKEVERRLTTFVDIEHRWNLIKKAVTAADAALDPKHLDQVLNVCNKIIAVENAPWLDSERNGWQLNTRVYRDALEVREYDGIDCLDSRWKVEVELRNTTTLPVEVLH